ncbi:MAG TPA: XrtA system polysaccharide deacetylase [Bryobacteraceae bacterium]|nr:XrtA system polysaccharide deacetylase [Bryobacteraceae bacterium]
MTAPVKIVPLLNALTVDVEEYFHPTEIQRSLPPEAWASLPSRVEAQTDWVLELLERHSARATFFVLGWVAERNPGLVRKIAAAGHEIGCHSYAHQLVYDLTPEQFRLDTVRALDAIYSAISGVVRSPVRAYRAPSYSITSRSLWALEVLGACGIRCDSSIYPIAHDRYGIPGFARHAHAVQTATGPILEVPIATARLSGKAVAPVGGGAYLRLLPYRYTAAGIRRINSREGQPACVYFHPWEIDPDQPRLAAGFASRLRTYAGLRGMRRKLSRLLSEFRFAALEDVYPYDKMTPAAATTAAAVS